MRTTFSTPYNQYKDREGQAFTLIRIIDKPDETHDIDCLPMYVITFWDGVEIEAWPEEIMDEL